MKKKGMQRPYVSFPDTPHTEGENHRTVNIKFNRDSISIICKNQATAHRLGKRLLGSICEALDNPMP